LGCGVSSLGFGVWVEILLELRVGGFGFGVWGVEFGVQGWVEGLRFEV